MQLSEQEVIRRQAKEQLEALGIDPYPSELYKVTHQAAAIKQNFLADNADQFKEVSLAGRIMSRRIMGSDGCRTRDC